MPPKPRDPIDKIDDLNAQLDKIWRDYLALAAAMAHGADVTAANQQLCETIRIARED